MIKTHYIATIDGKQQAFEASVTICQLQETVEELKAECDALRARIEEDAQSWYKLLLLMKKHGWHPGRTDDDLIDVLEEKLDALAADAEKSVKLLAMLFDRFENGVQCYEDPEDYTGFLGHAVNLTDDEFRECAEILNRLAPIAMKEANHD